MALSRLTESANLMLYAVMVVLLVAGGGVSLYLMTAQASRLDEEIDSLEMQLQKLTARRIDISKSEALKERLVREIESGTGRFYSTDEIDPYRFSRLIDELLCSHNLSVEKYQTIQTGDTLFLEYTIVGDSFGLVQFLQRVSNSDKYCHVPLLVIDAREKDGSIRAVFRIGYETIDTSSS
jgi:hypothetical protein